MSAIRSIRSFLGASNYEQSKQFYRELGFEVSDISSNMCYIKIADEIGFYLQDFYVKDWVSNSMLFLEADDLDSYWQVIKALDLPKRYGGEVKLSKIVDNDWGREFFLHDPSGVLWHIGNFKRQR